MSQLNVNRVQADAQDFDIKTDFSLQTGRGSVKFVLPMPNTKLQKLKERIQAWERDTNSNPGAMLTLVLDAIEDELVKPETIQVVLLPKQAQLLGMRLIGEGERAIGQAIALRMLLELGGVDITQAVQILQGVSQGTRADHQLEFEQRVKAQAAAVEQEQRDAALHQDSGGKAN